jgi:hypothetical protein
MKTYLKSIKAALLLGGLAFVSCESDPKFETKVQSNTFTVSQWTYNAPQWEARIDYWAITESALENGAVIAYINASGTYYALPATLFLSSQYSTSVRTAFIPGSAFLLWSDSDLIQPNHPGTFQVKIVVISEELVRRNPDIVNAPLHELEALELGVH